MSRLPDVETPTRDLADVRIDQVYSPIDDGKRQRHRPRYRAPVVKRQPRTQMYSLNQNNFYMYRKPKVAPQPELEESESSVLTDSSSLSEVSDSESSSSSALPVPTLPPALQLQLAALVPFDGGRHLCPTHEPRNTAKKSDIGYWFFKAAEQGCTQCVEFCVRSHHIDKHVLSNSGKWTASAFARDCGQFAMVDFIAQL